MPGEIPAFSAKSERERSNYVNALELRGFEAPLLWYPQGGISICRGSIAGVGPIWNASQIVASNAPAANDYLLEYQFTEGGVYDVRAFLARDAQTNIFFLYVLTDDADNVISYLRRIYWNNEKRDSMNWMEDFTFRIPDQGKFKIQILAQHLATNYYAQIWFDRRFNSF